MTMPTTAELAITQLDNYIGARGMHGGAGTHYAEDDKRIWGDLWANVVSAKEEYTVAFARVQELMHRGAAVATPREFDAILSELKTARSVYEEKRMAHRAAVALYQASKPKYDFRR